MSGIPSTTIQGVTITNGSAVTSPARPEGRVPTVRIARTLTGPPGAPARVANLGDPRNVLLAFSIPQGREGQPGIRGYPGPQGPPGPAGLPGHGFTVKGEVPTVNDLPAGAAEGDLYLVATTGIAYVWSGTSWVSLGELVGPAGPSGPAGAPGVPGAPGATGATGAAGPQGPVGPQGPQGNPGTGSTVTIPNAQIMSGNGTALGGITLGTGLSFTGAFPNQTLNSAGTAYTATAPITLTGTAFGMTAGTNGHVLTMVSGTAGWAAPAPSGAGSSNAAATNTGRLFVNMNTEPTIQASGGTVQITGTDAAADASTTVVVDAVVQPIIRTRKAMTSIAQTRLGGGALPANNTALFLLDMQGYNGNAAGFSSGAQIRAATAGAWIQGSNYPTRMEFWTTRTGAGNTAPVTAMTINGYGAVILAGAPDRTDPGVISAVEVWAAGENLRDLIQDLEDRIAALGG